MHAHSAGWQWVAAHATRFAAGAAAPYDVRAHCSPRQREQAPWMLPATQPPHAAFTSLSSSGDFSFSVPRGGVSSRCSRVVTPTATAIRKNGPVANNERAPPPLRTRNPRRIQRIHLCTLRKLFAGRLVVAEA